MAWTIYHFISSHLWLFAGAIFLGIMLKGVHKRHMHHKSAEKKYRDVIEREMHEPSSMYPLIDQSKCAGCGTCVASCPEGEIIKLINHKATLIEPAKCVGHGLCATNCPLGAITLVFGTKTKGMQMPCLDTDFQTNVTGLYVAGELGGMGLIRNAVKQGRLAALHAASHAGGAKHAMYDVVIVGAGPAGLSAALACKAAGKKYLCLEQNRFGGSICNFPRQKIVMTQPLDFALLGEVKFDHHKISKEQLLDVWQTIWHKYGLKIHEDAKFNTLRKTGDVFEIETAKGVITSQKVILAMGVRGTPRKLQVAGEDSVKVTYNLEDPAQYQHKWIAVVGAGNAAVEVAASLCRQQYHNRVYLLVRGKGFSRCNEDNQNRIMRYASKGRVKILFETNVTSISDDHIMVNQAGKGYRLQNDYMFIMAGAIMPHDFLKSLGIEIVIKYGEPVHQKSRKSS